MGGQIYHIRGDRSLHLEICVDILLMTEASFSARAGLLTNCSRAPGGAGRAV